MRRETLVWWLAGWVGFALLPWYAIEAGFFSFAWLADYPTKPAAAPALVLALAHGRWWLLPTGLVLLMPAFARAARPERLGTVLLSTGVAGLAWTLAQGFLIGL